MNLNDYMNTHRIKPNADIANRWETRIVPMNESGADCAAAYLDKYGKGIGPAKLHGLARMAELKGDQEMAIANLEESVSVVKSLSESTVDVLRFCHRLTVQGKCHLW